VGRSLPSEVTQKPLLLNDRIGVFEKQNSLGPSMVLGVIF